MMDIKNHVLELGNSMVASVKSFEWNQNKTLKTQTLANLIDIGPRVTCCVSKGKTKLKTIKYSQFCLFFASSDMLGNRKHVLELGN